MTPSRPGHGRFRPRRWAILLALAALGVVLFDLFMPAGPFPPHDRVVVLVQRGQNLRQIAEELRRVELLRGTLSFQVLARLMGIDRRIKAGQYAFRRGTSVPELLRLFSRGMGGLSLVRIPEGLTLTEVSLLLSNHLGVPAMAFDSLGRDPAFLDSLGVSAPNLEGYLAPNSYEFLPGTSPEVAFRTMVNRQLAIVARLREDRDSLPLPLTPHQALTLASIVESESQAREERPRIARVYLNRLVKGMRLQADPTVAYSLGKVPRSRLFLSQLRHQSPYNTYMIDGLPPGPICNPGEASIAGVYHPVPPNQELYFVARGQGRHFFANTYEEHLSNIRTAKAIQAASRAPVPAPDSAAAGEPVVPGAAVQGPEGPPAKVESAVKVDGPVKVPGTATTKAPVPAPTKVPAKATAPAKAPATAKPATDKR